MSHLKIPDISIEDSTLNSLPVKRKEFADKLYDLILKSEDERLVLSLTGKWGDGKTTFIKLFQKYINTDKDTKIKSIYFNAFDSDYSNEPFIDIVSEITNSLKQHKLLKTPYSKDLIKRSADVAGKLLSIGLGLALKTSTFNTINPEDVKNSKEIINAAKRKKTFLALIFVRRSLILFETNW